MSKILTGIAVALMAVTAALGFMNKGKIDTLKGEVASTETARQTAEGKAAAAAEAQKVAETSRDEEKAKATQAASELAGAKTVLDETKAKAEDLQKMVDAKTKEVEELTAKIAAAPADVAAPEMAAGVSDARVKELEAELLAAKQETAVLSEKIATEQERTQVLVKKEEARARAVMAKGLEGTITAYNPAWNFVVVNIGDRQSVAEGAEMVVVRNGRMLGKVKITSVEATTSIADVDLSSMTTGATIQPGDKVIFPGS